MIVSTTKKRDLNIKQFIECCYSILIQSIIPFMFDLTTFGSYTSLITYLIGYDYCHQLLIFC